MNLIFMILLIALASCAPEKIDRSKHDLGQEVDWERFADKVERKNDLQILGKYCSTHLVEAENTGWTLQLMTNDQETIEEGRVRIASLIEQAWRELHSRPHYQGLYDEMAAHNKRIDPTMKIERIGIKLSYWDEQWDRHLHPYLSQTIVKDGKIYYYYADPDTQALQEPIVEIIDKSRNLLR